MWYNELFPNYVPRPPLPRKVGGHDPPAPMGAPPLGDHLFTNALSTGECEVLLLIRSGFL